MSGRSRCGRAILVAITVAAALHPAAVGRVGNEVFASATEDPPPAPSISLTLTTPSTFLPESRTLSFAGSLFLVQEPLLVRGNDTNVSLRPLHVAMPGQSITLLVDGIPDNGLVLTDASGNYTAQLTFATREWHNVSAVAYAGTPNEVRALDLAVSPNTTVRTSGDGQIGAGSRHTCAVVSDGTARCWGANDHGQIGDATRETRLTPVPVSGLSGVAKLSAGDNHTCALLSGGTVRCWGKNDDGQLGDGTTDSTTPVDVVSLTGVIQVSAGDTHTCALSSEGAVRCWGGNEHGQLGNGTTEDSRNPVAVSGMPPAIGVTAGGHHTCALLSSGTARCWGLNTDGQLGDGSSASRSSPVDVTGLSGVTSLVAGSFHTCPVVSDGRGLCWGSDGSGQLGYGSIKDSRSATGRRP